jgi:DNA-binding beta-propeller fold protein YncE
MRNHHENFALYAFAILLFSCAIADAVRPAFAQTISARKVYVLDTDKRIIQSVGLDDESVTDSPKIDEIPNIMLLSPDGSRLVVFERGGGTTLSDSRWVGLPITRVGKMTAVDIFDTKDMRLTARIEKVGWNAAPNSMAIWPLAEINGLWDESGQLLTVLCWGKKNENPELVQLDVQKGIVTERFPLACKVSEVTPLRPVVPGTSAALVYENEEEQKKSKGKPIHKLVLVDLKDLSQTKEIPLSGYLDDFSVSPDSQYIYVFSYGSRKYKDSLDGHLHTVSARDGSLVKSLDGGFAFSEAAVYADAQLTLVGRVRKQGEKSVVLALKQGQEFGNVEIPDVPLKLRIAPRTKRLIVLCYDSLQVIDLESLKLIGSISTPHRKKGFWESGVKERPPSNLALTSDESAGILGLLGDDEFYVCDFKEFKLKNMIDLISGWQGFSFTWGQAALSGALAGLSSAVTGMPNYSQAWAHYVLPEYGSLLIDRSDQFAYILGGNTVVIIDLATNKKVTTIVYPFNVDYGYYFPQKLNSYLFLMGTGNASWAAWGRRLGVLDMNSNQQVIEQGWLGDCVYSEDRSFAINFDGNNIYLLDGLTLKVTKTIGGFKELRQLVAAPQILSVTSK